MSWLVELPDTSGQPMIINLDAPLVIQSDGARALLTTATGQLELGLSYEDLCARLRLNPADRQPADSAPRRRCLGRLPPRRDSRVPRLAVIAPTLPAAPPTHLAYVEAVSSWILGANDRVGDCTCVGPANVILALTTLAGDPKRLSDADILAFYASLTGYNPADPQTDQGAVIEDVLAAWHARGIAAATPDRLDGFATLDVTNHDRVREAIASLGPIDLGVNLPRGWEQATTWDVSTAGNGIAGGHCVTAVGYTARGPLIVSWGQLFQLTWAGWDMFVEEAHALLSRDALTRAGKDKEGIDWVGLQNLMTSLRGEAV